MSAKKTKLELTMNETRLLHRALNDLRKKSESGRLRPALDGPEKGALKRALAKLEAGLGFIVLLTTIGCTLPAQDALEAPKVSTPTLATENDDEARLALSGCLLALEDEFRAAQDMASKGARAVAGELQHFREELRTRRSCAVDTMLEMRAEEHSLLDRDDAERIVDAVVRASERHEVAPATLLGIGWKESRWMPVRGDSGNACGIWQQWPRWVPESCDDLFDVDIAANVVARQVSQLPNGALCHYNQGNECDPGETYSAGVERAAARFSGCFSPLRPGASPS